MSRLLMPVVVAAGRIDAHVGTDVADDRGEGADVVVAVT
jgi:hypothetical protein